MSYVTRVAPAKFENRDAEFHCDCGLFKTDQGLIFLTTGYIYLGKGAQDLRSPVVYGNMGRQIKAEWPDLADLVDLHCQPYTSAHRPVVVKYGLKPVPRVDRTKRG